MPDDLLTLRLRTATALGWKFDFERTHNIVGRGRTRFERYFRGEQKAFVFYYPDGEVGVETTMSDYPADLGACAEVLAAIEARNWTYDEWTERWLGGMRYFFRIFGPAPLNVEGPTLALWNANTLPEAICKAFCEACEGEAVREAADNA
jgi:hypothetical protein